MQIDHEDAKAAKVQLLLGDLCVCAVQFRNLDPTVGEVSILTSVLLLHDDFNSKILLGSRRRDGCRQFHSC